ncbi:MAG TPA: murein hydrolase regulator LrgA [Clostridiales bacterium]|nr:murein hydrolase regulator LrgA [Clostridiales bacterium]
MKYIRQLTIILVFTLAGELLNRLIPLPVPASIYGLLLMFGALAAGLLNVQAIRETALFLIAIMPILFVAPFVNLLDIWPIVEPFLLPVSLLIIISTLLTFGVSGLITQSIIKLKSGGGKHE